VLVLILTPDIVEKLIHPVHLANATQQNQPQNFGAHVTCKNIKVCQKYKFDKCPGFSSTFDDGLCKNYLGTKFQVYSMLLDKVTYLQHTNLTDKEKVKAIRKEIGKYQLYMCGRGVGKSTILIVFDTARLVSILPFFLQYKYDKITGRYIKLFDKPIPTRVILVANVKDNAIILQRALREIMHSHYIFYQQIAEESNTYMRLYNGSEIYVYTAGLDGGGVRGKHAKIIKTFEGTTIKSTIVIKFDELAFTRAEDVVRQVLEPSLSVGNAYSKIQGYTTPNGVSGEAYDLMSDERWLTMTFPSYFNKYIGLDMLLNERIFLEKTNRLNIYKQERLGIPQSDAGMFFESGEVLKSFEPTGSMSLWSEDDVIAINGKVSGSFIVGVDPNSFKNVKKPDRTAIALLERYDNKIILRALWYWYRIDARDFKMRLKLLDNKFTIKEFRIDDTCGYNSWGLDIQKRKLKDAKQKSKELYYNFWKSIINLGNYIQPYDGILKGEMQSLEIKELLTKKRIDHKGGHSSKYTNDLCDAICNGLQGFYSKSKIGVLI